MRLCVYVGWANPGSEWACVEGFFVCACTHGHTCNHILKDVHTLAQHTRSQCASECSENARNQCGSSPKDPLWPKWSCNCELKYISSNDACQPLFERYGLGADNSSVKAITKDIKGIRNQLKFWKAADRLWLVITTLIPICLFKYAGCSFACFQPSLYFTC
jgi:hypothetical protein